MATATMNVQVLFEVRSTTQWTAETTVIPKGFLCVETATVTDTSTDPATTKNVTKIKIGDGVKTYADLDYVAGNVEENFKAALDEALQKLNKMWHIAGKVTTKDELPVTGKDGDIYLVGAADATEYQEYYWTGTGWDYLGLTNSVTLADYYTKSEVDILLAKKLSIDDTPVFNVTLNV